MSENPEQAHAAFLEDRNSGRTYEDFCKACNRVLSTVDGQTMLHGMKLITYFDNACFIPEDGYDTHAAAGRDGSKDAIRNMLFAAKLGEKKKL